MDLKRDDVGTVIPPYFQISAVPAGQDGRPRVTVAGELDEGSGEPLIRAVTSLLGGSAPAVVEIEASGLNFVDSSGIRALLVCRGLVGDAGGRLILTDPRPAVTEVLEITHLCELFGLPAPAGAAPLPKGPLVSESMADLLARSAAVRRISREIREQARAMRLTGDLRRQPETPAGESPAPRSDG